MLKDTNLEFKVSFGFTGELQDKDSYQHKPDCDFPHTQLGTKSGRKGDYPQSKEWGAKGDRGYDNNTPKNMKAKPLSMNNEHELN